MMLPVAVAVAVAVAAVVVVVVVVVVGGVVVAGVGGWLVGCWCSVGGGLWAAGGVGSGRAQGFDGCLSRSGARTQRRFVEARFGLECWLVGWGGGCGGCGGGGG